MSGEPTDTNTALPNNGNGNGNGTSSWAMWQRLVLSEIKRLDEKCRELDRDKNEIMIKLAVLQTKAAMWGAVAGALFAGVIELIVYLSLGHMGGAKP
jgi:hypothetical protein